MKRFAWTTLLLYIVTAAAAQHGETLEVKQFTLSNGFTVWLNIDHNQPKVEGAVVVKAGAYDCPNTGIAHYFEHIMFKGTDKIGTVDYAAEKPWLDSISAQYSKLSQTRDEAQRNVIQKEINRMNLKAGEYAIPNEFPRLVSKYGGSGMNAYTANDMTVFFHTFSPQYLRHWAMLYSDRLIHPVFRLFQGELETVYEEKNLYADNLLNSALEKGLSLYFGTNPYAYPVIGSTENLKNPRLDEMEAFFKKYYVPSNMGIILCGDLDEAAVLPVLEETFGKVPQAAAPEKRVAPLPLHHGEEAVLKIKIPLVKAEVIAYNAPVDGDKDAPALDMATRLLTNENGSGYLDSLVNEHALMAALTQRVSFNHAGIQAVLVVPTVPFGSRKKGREMVMAQIERIKRGDFSQASLETLKQQALRSYKQTMETGISRGKQMVSLFSQGRTWQDYLEEQRSVASLTKQEVMQAAQRYFGDNHMTFVKKFGSYPKDKVSKPGYTPVVPAHAGEESQFAREMDQIEVASRAPRLIDFDKDVETVQLAPHATLYTAANEVNDLFTLDLIYHKGSLADARLTPLADYLATLGTDSLTKQQLSKALLGLGATLNVKAGKNDFTLTLTGVDKNLVPSLALLRHFMEHARADKKSMKELVSSSAIGDETLLQDNIEMLKVMAEKIAYGERSSYLTHVSTKDLKKMRGEELTALMKELMGNECSVVYSGSLPTEVVSRAVCDNLPVEKATKAGTYIFREPQAYGEPVVYFYNMPEARQSVVVNYFALKPCPTLAQRAQLKLWDCYYGASGLNSILFQEVREFRSFAYAAQSITLIPPMGWSDKRPASLSFLTTQGDKTLQAISLLDSIRQNLPLRPGNLEATRQEAVSEINNSYPSFREIGRAIVQDKIAGCTRDPNADLAEQLPALTLQDVAAYHRSEIATAPRVLIVIGNKKSFSVKELSRFGKVIELKREDIYK